MHLLDTHIVPKNTPKSRLSDYAVGIFPQIFSRKGIKKAINRNQIYVDEQIGKSGDWINPGQTIKLFERADQPPKSYPIKLNVLLEDDWLAIIHKPPGLSVSGNQYQTVFNALSYNLKPSKKIDALPWPLPVHRLDRPTAGCLLIAKTRSASTMLGKLFETQSILKTYHCIVEGQANNKQTIDTPLEGKTAITHFEKMENLISSKERPISLLKVMLETGRTHQIRKHLAQIGHPILGDQLYTPSGETVKKKGLFLVATRMKFKHPFTEQEIDIQIPLPKKFSRMIERGSNNLS